MGGSGREREPSVADVDVELLVLEPDLDKERIRALRGVGSNVLAQRDRQRGEAEGVAAGRFSERLGAPQPEALDGLLEFEPVWGERVGDRRGGSCLERALTRPASSRSRSRDDSTLVGMPGSPCASSV